MIDSDKFADELADIVRSVVNPMKKRIAHLERQIDGLSEVKGPPSVDEVADLVAEKISPSVDRLTEIVSGLPEMPTLTEIKSLIAHEVSEAVKGIPAPENGKDGKDGVDGAPGERGEKGDPGEDGADGIGLAGAMIDRDGVLILTMTNGETKSLGSVVGKDGAPGRDGYDGMGFEDLDFIYDDDGRVMARFQRGEITKSVYIPCIIDRGPYRADTSYQKGDAVSFGGSLWIAQDDTSEKPEGGKGWRLAVKRGRDGRDGKDASPKSDLEPSKSRKGD